MATVKKATYALAEKEWKSGLHSFFLAAIGMKSKKEKIIKRKKSLRKPVTSCRLDSDG